MSDNERGPGDPIVDNYVEQCIRHRQRRAADARAELVVARAAVKRPVDEMDRLRYVRNFLLVTNEFLTDRADELSPDERVACHRSVDYLGSSERREAELWTLRNRVDQSPSDIKKRWRAEGRTFQPKDVADEWHRAQLVLRREEETEILGRAVRLTAADVGERADRLRSVGEQIKDNRGDGNWTTRGYPKRRRTFIEAPHLSALPGPSDAQIHAQIRRDTAMWYVRETRVAARV